MKNVQVDAAGTLHCWKCGAAAFTEKRTARSKVMFGVGAFATKKKLKCQVCGEYNDVGNADPYVAKAGEPVAAWDWRKMRADQLAPGDVLKQAGMESTVESVTSGKLGLRIETDKGPLRAIPRSTEFTVRRVGE